MADSGIHGAGTTLKFAADSSVSTVTAIAQITAIKCSGIEVKDIDISTMDSTGKYRTFVAGMKNAGEISVDLIYEAANYSSMLAKVGGTIYHWRITLPDSSTFKCFGFVKSLGGAVMHDDKVTQTATIKLTAKPVFSG